MAQQAYVFVYGVTYALALRLQKLETDEDDSYLNSGWADPHSLKRQFHGVGDVRWRP